jgi:ribonucleoside-diphosphate reductase alpha chain
MKDAALVQKSGGGVGINWSKIRPNGFTIKSTGHKTRGVLQFIRVYADAMTVIDQGGVRPAANMAILSVHHPDILEFINMKLSGTIQNANMSVAITDEFVKAKENADKYNLYFPEGVKVGELDARMVWEKITTMAWRIGDPGVVWIDRVNKDNPNPSLGALRSSNPCGETFLLPGESCVLGSINLVMMLKKKIDTDSHVTYEWDMEKIDKVVPLAIRFLDGVIDASPQPLQTITEATQRTRKVGLGVMGFADALIKMGVAYDSMRGLEHADCIMKYINDKALEASVELGKEKGVFPIYENDKLGPPRRNAIVTTIAPTGSISAIAGVSSGIEPIYAVAYTRKAFGDTDLFEFQSELEQQLKQRNLHTKELAESIASEYKGSIQDTGLPDDLKKVFVTAHDISPEWHVRMQAQFQKHTGNSISKTINMKNEVSVQEVDDAYTLSYQLGCKGVTVYRDGSKDVQVLTTNKSIIGVTGGHGPRARIEDPSGRTYEIPFGYGDALITVNEDDIGMCEVIIKAGKSGTPLAAESEELGRLISLLLRSGVAVKYIIKQIRGISAGEVAFYKGRTIMSLGDAVAYAMEAFLLRKNPTKGSGSRVAKDLIGEISYKQNCPDCGTVVIHAAKCIECPNPLCGWSKCK